MLARPIDKLRRRLTRGGDGRQFVLDLLPRSGVGIEIGVWKGDFSARILAVSKPEILHLIDPWRVASDPDRTDRAMYGAGRLSQANLDEICDGVHRRFDRQTRAGRVIIHRADSTEVLPGLPESSVDFVYVDGDHSYEAVRDDLAAAVRVVRPGGLICCDDYLLGQWWQDGVVRAVHETLASHRLVVAQKSGAQIVLRRRAQ
ncbi:MAG TPA: class I SAM-dependent methyltransferase [Caulobacteraceae bacterium]|nr:class I SAM-dependent methyltransferase [Caulobacteraceae bacterium]